jgi:hypothetical protein
LVNGMADGIDVFFVNGINACLVNGVADGIDVFFVNGINTCLVDGIDPCFKVRPG